jgi:HK97 family phage prohead protease
LKYSVKVPETQLGRDIIEMVNRGDIDESSFKYSVRKGDHNFKRDENSDLIHTVERISGLYDVSLVVDGAFANTNIAIAKRSLEEFEREEQEEKDNIKKELTSKRNYLKTIQDEIK